MTKRKRYGAKVVRRRRNLYKVRKSGLRRGLEIAGMILLIGAIIFLGYSLGAPLMNYFSSGKAQQESQITTFGTSAPPQTSAPEPQTSAPDTEPTTTVTTPPPLDMSEMHAFAVPHTAMQNAASLSSVISQAKNSGYNTALLELKDSTGYVYYRSELEQIKDNEEIIKGGLTLAEIIKICENAGVTPAARISTLKDSKIQKHADGITYRFADGSSNWIDARPEEGGKPWANPFNKETADYIGGISEELAKGGIKLIVLENMMFPEFSSYDVSILPTEVSDPKKRSEALKSLADLCAEKAGAYSAEVFAAAEAADLLSPEGLSGGAEILRARSSAGVVVVFDMERLAEIPDDETGGTYDFSTVFEVTAEKIQRYTGDNAIPFLTGNIPETELDEIRKTYSRFGFGGDICG